MLNHVYKNTMRRLGEVLQADLKTCPDLSARLDGNDIVVTFGTGVAQALARVALDAKETPTERGTRLHKEIEQSLRHGVTVDHAKVDEIEFREHVLEADAVVYAELRPIPNNAEGRWPYVRRMRDEVARRTGIDRSDIGIGMYRGTGAEREIRAFAKVIKDRKCLVRVLFHVGEGHERTSRADKFVGELVNYKSPPNDMPGTIDVFPARSPRIPPEGLRAVLTKPDGSKVNGTYYGDGRFVEDTGPELIDGLTRAQCLARFVHLQRAEGNNRPVVSSGTYRMTLGLAPMDCESLVTLTPAQLVVAREEWSAAVKLRAENRREADRERARANEIVVDDDRWDP